MTLRYDKLMIDKDVYTYNEVAGVVELQTSSVEEGRVSPTSQPNTPHHNRVRARSKSSGRKKKLEKSYSTGFTYAIRICQFTHRISRISSQLHWG